LESALKYSGLYVDAEGDYAEIKAIPAFLLTSPDPSNPTKPNNVRCGCDAYKQLQEIKTKAREKVKHLQEQVEEMGYKIKELEIGIDLPKPKPTSLEFWEALGKNWADISEEK
jgi:hypothetical protein